jgi:hypothetical protein
MTKTGQFFSEFIASAMLMFLIYALKDDGNIGAGALTPLGLFFVIFGIGACFGWETGYAINLARDFGPRLMSYFLGRSYWLALPDHRCLLSPRKFADMVSYRLWPRGLGSRQLLLLGTIRSIHASKPK